MDGGASFTSIDASKNNIILWSISVITEKCSRMFVSKNMKASLLSNYISRRSILLLRAVKKLQAEFDLIIGHNPAALYPTYFAARKFECRAGFDVEDYHPGETDDVYMSKIIREYLVQLLPKMSYVSFASYSIKDHIEKACGVTGTVVINSFPASEFVEPMPIEGNLKLVWFSQNISYGRGLEELIPAMQQNPDIELHLIGKMDADFEASFLPAKNVIVHSALPQQELHKFLNYFDVGLALETSEKLYNRELTLTNKLLAYLQAGLMVLATDTLEQKNFLHSKPGLLIKEDFSDFQEKLGRLKADVQQLRNEKLSRFKAASQLCWEQVSEGLLANWNSVNVPMVLKNAD